MDNDRFHVGRVVALRDMADLMIWPWFSLAKQPRSTPILFEQGEVRIRVEPAGRFGFATIWDADLLLWAISQWTEELDAGRTPSRQLETSPYRLLRGLGRGTGHHDYTLLRAAFDRLAATEVETTVRAADPRELARFRWLESWEPVSTGVRLTLPDWLFAAVCERRVLTLDPGYFALTGGLARWLYRLVRKMGRPPAEWRRHRPAPAARPQRQPGPLRRLRVRRPARRGRRPAGLPAVDRAGRRRGPVAVLPRANRGELIHNPLWTGCE